MNKLLRSVILKRFFCAKDLRKCFGLDFRLLGSSTMQLNVLGRRASEVHFRLKHLGRSFAQKKRFRMTDQPSTTFSNTL